MVREELNPDLKILGIVPFKFDRRLKASRRNLESIKKFEDKVKVYPPVPYRREEGNQREEGQV